MYRKSRFCLVAAVLPSVLGTEASAGSIEQQLAKLDPEERAHQACVIKGLEAMPREHKLVEADRIKTGIFRRPSFAGNVVDAPGGAVRAQNRWYRLTFKCTVTGDQMKATAFTYSIGTEIPKSQWDDLGLW